MLNNLHINIFCRRIQMDVIKNKNGTELYAAVKGRLDTNTAPKLQDELQSELSDITDLTLDLNELVYVSSAGLRVILFLQKTMNKQGKMKVKNVCPDVMDIFDITGFSDILTIE